MNYLTLDRISYLAANGTSYDPDHDLTQLARQYLQLKSKLPKSNKIVSNQQMTESMLASFRDIKVVKSFDSKYYPEIIQRLAVRCYLQKKSFATVRRAQRVLSAQLKNGVL